MKKIGCYLTDGLLDKISEFEGINEIRIKRNSRVVLQLNGNDKVIDYKVSSQEFDEIMDKLLDRSYHSKLPELLCGYISLGSGYRCGVVGHAVVNDGKLANISEITSVCIRIPYLMRGICGPVIDVLKKRNFSKGVLIYSPPGQGKTTLLRDLAIRLCDVPINKKVALIDSRRELYLPLMDKYPMLYGYIGYPKAQGIENAVRTFAPDVIICDEIGNAEETETILSNQSSGVPIIATAHGSCYSDLISGPNLQKLYSAGIFSAYIGIRRSGNSGKFNFEITEV